MDFFSCVIVNQRKNESQCFQGQSATRLYSSYKKWNINQMIIIANLNWFYSSCTEYFHQHKSVPRIYRLELNNVVTHFWCQCRSMASEKSDNWHLELILRATYWWLASHESNTQDVYYAQITKKPLCATLRLFCPVLLSSRSIQRAGVQIWSNS